MSETTDTVIEKLKAFTEDMKAKRDLLYKYIHEQERMLGLPFTNFNETEEPLPF